MDSNQIEVSLIKYGSPEYLQACRLRFQLFFAEHGLPWSTVFGDRHNDFYAAIAVQGIVVAYGELVPQANLVYRIGQMVVHPDYQRRSLGKKILSTLIDLAKKEGATSLTLNARLTAVGFYQKLGFEAVGKQFPSTTTGVMHIAMNREL